MSSDKTPLNQRSVWGVSLRAVKNLIANHGRETQALRGRIAEREAQASVSTAQREEATPCVSGEHTVSQNRVREREARLPTAPSQTRASEEELSLLRESADRINVPREAVVPVVAERTRDALQAEAAEVWAQLDDEKARHRAEVERFGKQRVQMLMQLEAITRGLLDHATLIKGGEATATVVSSLEAALRSLSATAAAAAAPDAPPIPARRTLVSLPPELAAPVAPPATPVVESARAVALVPLPTSVTHGNGAGAIATEHVAALTSAMNELEALLTLPRERWQEQTNGGDGKNDANDVTANREAANGRDAAELLIRPPKT